MTENEFLLQDRLGVIRDTINKYGEDSWCISFSGGKDSVVLHNLIDLAIPGNKIPRVYANTGIEWFEMVRFVKKMKEKDDRIVMIQPSVNIKKVLEEYGYPFKSKQHSFYVRVYQRNGMSAKAVQFYLKETGGKFDCPTKLRYQFTEEFKERMKINDSCCKYMKEKPLDEYKKANGKPNQILGLMAEEGGRRASVNCMTRIGKKCPSIRCPRSRKNGKIGSSRNTTSNYARCIIHLTISIDQAARAVRSLSIYKNSWKQWKSTFQTKENNANIFGNLSMKNTEESVTD